MIRKSEKMVTSREKELKFSHKRILERQKENDVFPGFENFFRMGHKGGKEAFVSVVGVEENVLRFIFEQYLKDSDFLESELMWMFSFFKRTLTIPELKVLWGIGNRKDILSKINGLIDLLGEKMNTIKMSNRFKDTSFIETNGLMKNVTMYVDTLPMIIRCLKDNVLRDLCCYGKGTPKYAKKFMLAVSIGTGMICFASKSFVGRNSDVRIMRECGLLSLLSKGERVAGDKAFRGTEFNTQILTSIEAQELWQKKCFNYSRQLIERINGRINTFDIIKKKPFRGDILKRFDKIFLIIAETVNIDIMLNLPEKNRFLKMIENEELFWKYVKSERKDVMKKFESFHSEDLKGVNSYDSHLDDKDNYNEIFKERLSEST